MASKEPEMVDCPACDASGKCRECHGSGKVTKGFFTKREEFCPLCKGTAACAGCKGQGEIDSSTPKVKCPKCSLIFHVPVTADTIEFLCPSCGVKMIFRYKEGQKARHRTW